MTSLVDSSVILRKLFGEPDQLQEWSRVTTAYVSRLAALEIGRVIDRSRLAGQLDDDQVAHLHEEARRVLASSEVVAMTERILARAGGPMPTALGALDAIHLATALEISPQIDEPLAVLTHDAQLARAARASGFTVFGA